MAGKTHEMSSTLILGGTGKTGRRVVQRLRALDIATRVGSRSGEPPFDWEDQTTWAPALRDIGQIYVTYQPDLAFPEASTRVRSFVDVAVRSGVRRLVLLSGRNEDGAVVAEQAVQTSGLDWTVVRSSMFSQDFSEAFLLEPLLDGGLAFPAGEVREPFIDAEDIADIVAAALTEDGHVGQLYESPAPGSSASPTPSPRSRRRPIASSVTCPSRPRSTRRECSTPAFPATR